MKRRMSRQAWQIALKHTRVTSSVPTKTSPARKCDVPCRCFTCSAVRGNLTYKLSVLPRTCMPKSLHSRRRPSPLRTRSGLSPSSRQMSRMIKKETPVFNQIVKLKVNSKLIKSARSASCCPVPCCPPAGCTLPPPCNQPPRCLQSMTGYYHYPYGFWFCGPYHVSTGPVPVDGPVRPGGACGPIAGPCPCFNSAGNPCNPCGPCGPCAPCGPCGPCAPCAPCGPCGVCAPCGPCGVCATCGLSALCHAQPALYHAQRDTCPSQHAPQLQWNTTYSHDNLCDQCGYPKQSAPVAPKRAIRTENAVPKNLEAKSSDTLPSKVAAQSLSTILDHASTKSTIEIDPSFIKTFPFNKPTFKRTESAMKPPTEKKPK